MKKIDKLYYGFIRSSQNDIKAFDKLNKMFSILFNKNYKNMICKDFKFVIIGNKVYFRTLTDNPLTLFVKNLSKYEKNIYYKK